MPLFVQNEEDAAAVKKDGFTNVRILGAAQDFKGVTLTKTEGQHGSDQAMQAIGHLLGKTCGVLFSHPDAHTIYLAGDTIWTDDVALTLADAKPEIIILNCGDAQVPGLGGLIMGAEDVLLTHKAAPNAMIVASHMEAVNHCVLTRASLRAYARDNGFSKHLLVPGDGETVTM